MKSSKAWLKRAEIGDWAKGYLERRALRHPGSRTPDQVMQDLLSIDNLKGNTPENHELLRKMKGAWGQRKLRKNTVDRISCSFQVSKAADKSLDRLSSDYGTTKTAALEKIISDALKRENDHKKDRRDDSVYKKRASLLEKHLDHALKELHEQKLVLETANHTTPLTKKQRKEAASRYRKSKNAVIASLPELPSRARKAPKPSSRRKGSFKDTKPSAPLQKTLDEHPSMFAKDHELQATGEATNTDLIPITQNEHAVTAPATTVVTEKPKNLKSWKVTEVMRNGETRVLEVRPKNQWVKYKPKP